MRKLTLVTLLALALSLAVQAQDVGGWDIQTDVDGDGVVGPTDIQHVINGALGLHHEGPAAINVPRRQYVVASPRAALLPVPRTDDPSVIGNTVGTVDNFPRPNGRLLVKAGTVVTLRFDRNVEGIWYTGACGLLRSVLRVEMRPIPVIDETTDGELSSTGITAGMMGPGGMHNGPGPGPGDHMMDNPVLDQGDEPVLDGEDPDGIEWTPVARDGAQANRCGPAAGTATVAVRALFETPGDYLLRAHIDTAAVPESELPADVVQEGAVRKHDIVLVHVRVLDQNAEPTQERWMWQEDREAESVPHRFGDMMHHELDDSVNLPNAERP